MKKLFIRTMFSLLLLGVAGWTLPSSVALAQQNDTDIITARTVVRGFFSGVKANYLSPEQIAEFYLADSTTQPDIPAFDAFFITGEALSAGQYHATVTLSPGGTAFAVTAEKLGARWRITAIITKIPAASAAVVNATETETPVTTASETLIVQPQTGGAFYLVNSDGSGLRYLSSGIDPAPSPDGTKIAFTRWGSGEVGALWIYDLTTNTEWQVLGEMYEPKSPSWSADGTQIVISYQHGGEREPYRECVVFGHKIPRKAYHIWIDRDAGKICYMMPADTHWQLRLVNVSTGAFEDLPSPLYSMAPTWDPVNDWRVVFASSIGLQQFDLNRGEYFLFGTPDLRDHAPVFSLDGRTVAVTYKQDNHWEIYTIDTTTGTRTRLTQSPTFADTPVNNAAPAWSADGSRIYFLTDRTSDWELWVMNADGSNQQPLFSDKITNQFDFEYSGVDERLIVVVGQ